MLQTRTKLLLVLLIVPGAISGNFLEYIAPALNSVRVIDPNITTENLVTRFGYGLERYRVETEDGYLLTLVRLINRNGKVNMKKGIVLLQHGVLSASDLWLLRGPQEDLAFLLAARGYDVWLSNCRGNTYSRHHRHLNATDPRFWSFSFHEIGKYDLPAIVDFILTQTKQKSLNYIGHSMGTTVLFVLLSLRPEYNTKIRLGICLAPVVYFRHTPSPQLQTALTLTPKLAFILSAKNRYEFLPRQKRTIDFIERTCFVNDNVADLCFLIYSQVFGGHGRFFDRELEKMSFDLGIKRGKVPKKLLNIVFIMTSLYQTSILIQALFPSIIKHYPAGASINTMLHFAQNYLTGSFRPMSITQRGIYDLYGANQPSNYNIDNVRAPIALYYSSADILATPQDVVYLAKQLSNLRGIYRLPFDDFSHSDFVWGARNSTNLLYNHIMKLLIKS